VASLVATGRSNRQAAAELLFQEEQKTSCENFFHPAEACGKNCRTDNDARRRAYRSRTNVPVHGRQVWPG